MSYPTSEQFPSSTAAIEACKAAAVSQGYALIIRRSKPTLVNMECDRNGQHVYEGRGFRKSSTQRCGCEFNLQIRRYGTATQAYWQAFIGKGDHNHDASTDDDEGMRGHAVARRLTEEQRSV